MKWRPALAGVLLPAILACRPSAPIAPTLTPRAAQPLQTPATVVVQAVTVTVPSPETVAVRPVASPSPAAVPLSLVAGRSGADLRTSLDLLLSNDAFLTSAALDAAANARIDKLVGVSSALDQNATTLAQIIGAVKGQPAAEALLDAWRARLADLVSYAQGQSSATSNIAKARAVISTQLAFGSLSPTNVADLVERRDQATLALADRFTAHASAQSAEQLKSLSASSDDLGGPLAAALAARLPDLLPPATQGSDIDLQLRLTSLLQSRIYFTGAAMEAAADGRARDAQSWSDAALLDAQSIGDVLSGAYGSEVGSVVADQLRSQTSAFVSATTPASRGQSASDVDRLRTAIDVTLSGANPLLAPGLTAQQLRASDQPLLTAADAFAAHDYTTAFARLRESAKASQKPAETLGLAIVDRYPARYLTPPTPVPMPAADTPP